MLKRLLVLALMMPGTLFSQKFIQGKVTDKENGKALPFVNLIYNDQQKGTTTDIEGNFYIPAKTAEYIKISYVGYYSDSIAINLNNNFLNIILKPKNFKLPEAVVRPGINPAHRIIKEVLRNRDKNNPEENTSFAYKCYDKFFYEISIDSLKKYDSVLNGLKPRDILSSRDSFKLDFQKEIEEKYFFLKETVSQKEFLSKSRNKETVLLNRVSGVSDAGFILLASQLQSFTFYDPVFNLMEVQYINPISTGSTSRYFFELNDTLYNEQGDSTFTIYFRPFKGKNFDGLKGFLHINSNGYAIENVIAEPAEQGVFSVKFQQKYKLFDNKQWFPVQKYADFKIKILGAQFGENMNPQMQGCGRTYLDSIILNPDLSKTRFTDIKLGFDKNYHKNNNPLSLEKYRPVPLNSREIKTYEVIDSIGKEMHLDKLVNTVEYLNYQRIPVGWFDIDMKRLIDINEFEGINIGLGLYTNHKISPWYSLGGYYQYGTKDHLQKYGASADIWFNRKLRTGIRFEIQDDLLEMGSNEFDEQFAFMATAAQRAYTIEDLYQIKQVKGSLKFRPFRYLQLTPFFAWQKLYSTQAYSYNNFDFNAIDAIQYGVKLRYAFREKLTELRNSIFSEGTNSPIFYFNYSRTSDHKTNQFDVQSFTFRIQDNFNTVFTGKTHYTIDLGYQLGNAPLPLQYCAPGNFNNFSFLSTQCFETMQPGTFFSDRFAHIYLKQDLGRLLIRNKFMKPNLSLIHNMGFGTMQNKNQHSEFVFNTYEKGYFESGLEIKNILKYYYFNLGLGTFYHYGTYASTDIKSNFAFKLSFSIVFD